MYQKCLKQNPSSQNHIHDGRHWLALLLVLSITVYTTTITKSQASFVVAWAQQGNLSSPTSMKSMT
jgi:Na+(H+)/acetate symporter ActP